MQVFKNTNKYVSMHVGKYVSKYEVSTHVSKHVCMQFLNVFVYLDSQKLRINRRLGEKPADRVS